MKNKKIYYEIYSEFYNVNKYRELKSIMYHGNNKLGHINRVAKMSFFVSKFLNLDYVSCARGAMMHDFYKNDDLSDNKKYMSVVLDNSNQFFDVNDIEKDIILSNTFPIIKARPHYKESKIVYFCDKIVNVYEFFRYQVNIPVKITLILLMGNI